MDINIKINLDWASYEDDISTAIKNAVMDAVRVEARKHVKDIRCAVASIMKKREKELVARAMTALDKEK